jgi:hypothetical protein
MKIIDAYIGKDRLTDIFAAELELEGDYVSHLLDADDWTMMILSWALVEACLNQAIIRQLANESLSSFVERLSIGGRSGKAELAFSLGILTKKEQNFIDAYSEVRNRFAHGVKRFKTTFDDFFASVDNPAKFESAIFCKELPYFSGGSPTTFESDKRTMIFLNVTTLCVNIIRKSKSISKGVVEQPNEMS